jgi:hypothetical protein
MMSRTVAVASSEPSRLTRLLSVLAEWLEINIITHDLCDGGSAHAEVVFCRTADEVESALASTARERLVLFRGKSRSNRRLHVYLLLWNGLQITSRPEAMYIDAL